MIFVHFLNFVLKRRKIKRNFRYQMLTFLSVSVLTESRLMEYILVMLWIFFDIFFALLFVRLVE